MRRDSGIINMMHEVNDYVTVGPVDDFAPNSMRVLKVEGEEIVVARYEDVFYAFSNYCPHNELPMINGYFEGCAVVCAHHGAAFDVETGEILREPSYAPLPIFGVRLVDGQVQVSKKPLVPAGAPTA